MIIVQDIEVTWSKRSRGAPGSAVRNSVPEIMPSPSNLKAEAGLLNLIHQKIVYSEWDNFFASPREQLTTMALTKKKYETGSIWIVPEVSQVSVIFRYAGDLGLPDRLGILPATIFTLVPEQWGQVVYNGRQGDWEGDWIYNKRVLNIGLFTKPPEDNLFDSAKPIRRFEAMADLF